MRRRLSMLAFVIVALPLLFGAERCSWPGPAPTPNPTPAPTPPPPPLPICETGQGCDCFVWVDVTQSYRMLSCVAPRQCQNFACVNPDPGPVVDCTLPTPTARELKAQGKNPSINVQPEGKKQITATPVADFGAAYYCAIGWDEACNEGRRRGPVAPDGHPQRLACEAKFLEQPCPTFSMAACTGTAQQCPITFDPYFVIDGINQNHPQNVAAGCPESSWIRQNDQVVKGQFWRATAHGKGTIKACNKDGSVCGVSGFEINQ